MGLSKRHRTKGRKVKRSKPKAPRRNQKPQSKVRRHFEGYSDSFLTARQTEAVETMLGTNSLKTTCEKMGITDARYYQLVSGVVKAWGRAQTTVNRCMGWYQKAKNQKNLAARHLTVVRRIEVTIPIPSAQTNPALSLTVPMEPDEN